ncbi:MAG: bifunctional diguanylate cyclase/phosphodiesterase [Cellvibrionaceae bacterium]
MALLRVPNFDRQGLFQSLNKLLGQAKTEAPDNLQPLLGMIMVDIKNFTSINRVYDFKHGDLLLYFVFQRLAEYTASKDCVFRVGSDEFAVIVPQLESSGRIVLEANNLLDTLRQPYEWQGQEISVDVSLGCIAMSAVGTTAERLLSSAEHMLQRAKLENHSICFGTDSEAERDDSTWLLEQDLLRAMHNNELDMVFQPKMDLQSGTPTHAEALLRWEHPERGYISPDFLVEMVARLNREFELTKWVLHTALRRIKQWPDRWGLNGVAVNIPANIVQHADFCQLVDDSLHIWQVQPRQLTLEITENAIMENQQASFSNLDYLKGRGVKISIDDFGTGYSSLQYFKTIPATELKIDQSFVLNMADNNDDRNIAESIIQLAHRFGLKVVAEGVEDGEVLRELKDLGCDYAQGYFISRPLSHERYCEWLAGYQVNREQGTGNREQGTMNNEQ